MRDHFELTFFAPMEKPGQKMGENALVMMDKMFKISSLKIFTAGGSGGDIIIPGLAPDLAQRLKEALAAKLTTNEV